MNSNARIKQKFINNRNKDRCDRCTFGNEEQVFDRIKFWSPAGDKLVECLFISASLWDLKHFCAHRLQGSRNFLNHHCAVHSLVVSLISPTFQSSLNWNRKIVRICFLGHYVFNTLGEIRKTNLKIKLISHILENYIQSQWNLIPTWPRIKHLK